MKNINIAICEDNQTDTKQLMKYLGVIENELELTITIQTYETGTDFLNHFCPDTDMVFLDVQLPDMPGDAVAQKLRCRDSSVYLVFISKHIDFFSIGFAHEARNYLLKPIHYSQIKEEIQKYLNCDTGQHHSHLWISQKKGTRKIYLSKLRYIETDNRRLVLHYESDIIHHSDKISDFIKRLPEQYFFRCNTSYIVNLCYIERIVPDINRYRIYLRTGEIIPLSRNKKKDLLLQLQKAGGYFL